jgi:serine/threonine protein kinase
MSRDRWRQIEALYHSARERTPEDRSAYLEHACSGDEPLRREVESLLAEEERAVKFLETDEPSLEPAIAAPIRAGEQVGPYQVLEFLQKGGMGEIYKALDVRLDRTVAIKFLPHAFAGAPDALERFQREVRAASALNHPQICTVHDLGEHQGRPFYVMEFLDGQSLRDRIADKPMAIPAIVDLGMQICDALQAAHAKGIIHRDIKPANIFATAGGQIKILDFGIAKLVTKPHSPPAATTRGQTTATITAIAATRPGRLMGTLAYLSPEQARGEEVDTRTDIFSFGIVLYQMATGELAFRGETPEELINAILHQAPVKPSELNPGVPATLERIILRALEKDRNARYQSIEELFADLRKLQQGRPRWFSAAALLLVFLAVLAAAYLIDVMRPRRTQVSGGVPNLVQRQVTANPNNDSVYAAAISADGNQLAYTDLEGVHVRIIDTGVVHSIPLPSGMCFR